MVNRKNPGEGPRRWWGRFDFDIGSCVRWQIDSLQLTVLRLEREWQIAPHWQADGSPVEDWRVEQNASMPEEPSGLQRHAFSRAIGPFQILPVVADRPVVTSPRIPLFLPPGEQVTLFVGSPLWVRVEVDDPPKLLAEFPIFRASDTWFGPSTREGEVCYATRTQAIVEASNIPVLTRTAITPVTIENQTAGSLPVERLKLPVPFLSVYASPTGELWTSSVSMVFQEGAEMASFDVGPGPPGDVVAELLTEARARPEPGVLIKAFSLLQAFDREG